MMGGGMVEADHSAHQARPPAAAAVAENRIAVVQVVMGERLDACRGDSRLARKDVSPTVGNESQVALPESSISRLLDREPAAARSHHVKAQAARKRRKLDGPGGGKLGPAVEHSRHPQEMERLSQRIASPNPFHPRGEYPPLWTIEQETETSGP
jgi:hypothetical protein